MTATNDSMDDDGESVLLLAEGTQRPTGVSLGINGESTVNITDNERSSGAERDSSDQQDQPGRGN